MRAVARSTRFSGSGDGAVSATALAREAGNAAGVSLREGALELLGLRGKFEVNGRVTAEVVLERGQHVRFSERTSFEILEVTVPEQVLMFEGELGRVLLSGPTSLLEDGRVVAGPRQDAALVFWCDGERWFGGPGMASTTP